MLLPHRDCNNLPPLHHNNRLQARQIKQMHKSHNPAAFCNLTTVISQTTMSVKEALVGKSTTWEDQSTITGPTSHEAAGS
jgi:hypothetical protein